MQTNSLTQIVQHVFPSAEIQATFNEKSHIEFILYRSKNGKSNLIYLPLELDTCMLFSVNMGLNKFIHEFQCLAQQKRLSYVINKFMPTSWCDIPTEHSHYLQKHINSEHGIHN